MPLRFSWDEAKASTNLTKHHVAFEEAATVLGDPLSLTIPDPLHSAPDDERLVTIGLSTTGRLLVVVHSDQDESIRIISGRLATRQERADYEENA
ncbi:MAG TPA: BrnT family toxin [Chloroflexota bacterium]|nr:BrnT family toxin [Chloroflexota bacterium]